MIKKITVNFVDFSADFDKENNIFVKLLRERGYETELSEQPDYLFYSVFGKKHLEYDCIRIFYTGENIYPDFNVCDYAVGFHYLHVQDRYIRIPLYAEMQYRNDVIKLMHKHEQVDEQTLAEKEKFCNFVYSNGDADPKRKEFFDLLSQYKTVDSGGRYCNNIGGPVPDKYEFQRKYKFSVAFENVSEEGYSTEKLVQAFAAETIPIYWGDYSISKVFNNKAFINCHEYGSFEDIVEKIKEIDADNELFLAMLREPAFRKEEQIEIYEHELGDFLQNIVSQDKNEAIRRSRYSFTRSYNIRLLKESMQLEEWKWVRNKLSKSYIGRKIMGYVFRKSHENTPNQK